MSLFRFSEKDDLELLQNDGDFDAKIITYSSERSLYVNMGVVALVLAVVVIVFCLSTQKQFDIGAFSPVICFFVMVFAYASDRDNKVKMLKLFQKLKKDSEVRSVAVKD